MSRQHRPLLRTALVGALALAMGLALSACGRRGPPDAPPAVLAPPQQGAGFDTDGKPIAPPGVNRRLPIDAILD